jgi:hypothetical protein
MTNAQFASAMAVASALNTASVVTGILINYSKLRDLRANVDALFDHVDRCFDNVSDARSDAGPRPT